MIPLLVLDASCVPSYVAEQERKLAKREKRRGKKLEYNSLREQLAILLTL